MVINACYVDIINIVNDGKSFIDFGHAFTHPYLEG